jgi:hypothetical protein
MQTSQSSFSIKPSNKILYSVSQMAEEAQQIQNQQQNQPHVNQAPDKVDNQRQSVGLSIKQSGTSIQDYY